MSQQNELYSTTAAGNAGNKRMRTNNGKHREDYQDKDKEKQASTYSNYRIRASRTTATTHLMMKPTQIMKISTRK